MSEINYFTLKNEHEKDLSCPFLFSERQKRNSFHFGCVRNPYNLQGKVTAKMDVFLIL